jgi:hypothetical protein
MTGNWVVRMREMSDGGREDAEGAGDNVKY